MWEVLLKGVDLHNKRVPALASLSCKLVPAQNRENEYDVMTGARNEYFVWLQITSVFQTQRHVKSFLLQFTNWSCSEGQYQMRGSFAWVFLAQMAGVLVNDQTEGPFLPGPLICNCWWKEYYPTAQRTVTYFYNLD